MKDHASKAWLHPGTAEAREFELRCAISHLGARHVLQRGSTYTHRQPDPLPGGLVIPRFERII